MVRGGKAMMKVDAFVLQRNWAICKVTTALVLALAAICKNGLAGDDRFEVLADQLEGGIVELRIALRLADHTHNLRLLRSSLPCAPTLRRTHPCWSDGAAAAARRECLVVVHCREVS